MSVSRVPLIAGLLVAAAASMSAQVTTSSRTGNTTSVSPSVLAMYVGERVEPGMERLQLLVLWRGEPGWYARNAGGSSGGSGGGADTYTVRHSQGGIQLEATLDFRTQRVTVAGQSFDLRHSNVILVDGTGVQPAVVGTFGVQALVTARPGVMGVARIAELFAQPDIKAFLRCDRQASTRLTVAANMC